RQHATRKHAGLFAEPDAIRPVDAFRQLFASRAFQERNIANGMAGSGEDVRHWLRLYRFHAVAVQKNAGSGSMRGMRVMKTNWPMAEVSKKSFTALLSSILIAGCVVGPKYQKPPVAVPDNFRSQPVSAPDAASFADLPWWIVFDDK